jgi:hypothetical protein
MCSGCTGQYRVSNCVAPVAPCCTVPQLVLHRVAPCQNCAVPGCTVLHQTVLHQVVTRLHQVAPGAKRCTTRLHSGVALWLHQVATRLHQVVTRLHQVAPCCTVLQSGQHCVALCCTVLHLCTAAPSGCTVLHQLHQVVTVLQLCCTSCTRSQVALCCTEVKIRLHQVAPGCTML